MEELSVQCSSSGVCLAEGFSRFYKEALTLQIFLAKLKWKWLLQEYVDYLKDICKSTALSFQSLSLETNYVVTR